MRNNVDIDRTELVHRTDQLHLFVPGQVTQIQNPQLAKFDDRAKGAWIFGLVGGTLLGGRTARICSSDRKSTRLNSSHGYISYAVFCLKKKNKIIFITQQI